MQLHSSFRLSLPVKIWTVKIWTVMTNPNPNPNPNTNANPD